MCDRLECDDEYIGESAGTLRERLKEHVRAASPLCNHANITGHHTRVDNFSIVGRKLYSIPRTTREAMKIRVNDPSLNRNIGKFQLSHIWDKVLFNTLTINLNSPFHNSSYPLQ